MPSARDLTDEAFDKVIRGKLRSTYQCDFKGMPQGEQAYQGAVHNNCRLLPKGRGQGLRSFANFDSVDRDLHNKFDLNLLTRLAHFHVLRFDLEFKEITR